MPRLIAIIKQKVDSSVELLDIMSAQLTTALNQQPVLELTVYHENADPANVGDKIKLCQGEQTLFKGTIQHKNPLNKNTAKLTIQPMSEESFMQKLIAFIKTREGYDSVLFRHIPHAKWVQYTGINMLFCPITHKLRTPEESHILLGAAYKKESLKTVVEPKLGPLTLSFKYDVRLSQVYTSNLHTLIESTLEERPPAASEDEKWRQQARRTFHNYGSCVHDSLSTQKVAGDYTISPQNNNAVTIAPKYQLNGRLVYALKKASNMRIQYNINYPSQSAANPEQLTIKLSNNWLQPSKWQVNHHYTMGEIVKHSGNIYRARAAHQSATFSPEDWENLGEYESPRFLTRPLHTTSRGQKLLATIKHMGEAVYAHNSSTHYTVELPFEKDLPLGASIEITSPAGASLTGQLIQKKEHWSHKGYTQHLVLKHTPASQEYNYESVRAEHFTPFFTPKQLINTAGTAPRFCAKALHTAQINRVITLNATAKE